MLHSLLPLWRKFVVAVGRNPSANVKLVLLQSPHLCAHQAVALLQRFLSLDRLSVSRVSLDDFMPLPLLPRHSDLLKR